MHILSSHLRSEFLATPQLIRLDYVQGRSLREPTLLIKVSTLLLKYIILGAKMQIAFSNLGGRLIYGLKIFDDVDGAAVVWSVLERQQELDAIHALLAEKSLQVFLFNELAVNVSWMEIQIIENFHLPALIQNVKIGEVDHSTIRLLAKSILENFHNADTSHEDLALINLENSPKWNKINNTYITANAASSPIDIFHNNEGFQQEQAALWLTDNIDPKSVHPSPQIPKGKFFRELTDIILSHEYGAILIESKALTILGRSVLPGRSKLTHDISGHIKKATDQLRGGMRRLRDGTPVTSISGEVLDIERTKPMHGIILIPDLDLIQNPETYGLAFMKDFVQRTGGLIHILDVAELLRVVQAAEMIFSRGTKITKIMAFDAYLVERFEKAQARGTLCIEVLLRFADE